MAAGICHGHLPPLLGELLPSSALGADFFARCAVLCDFSAYRACGRWRCTVRKMEFDGCAEALRSSSSGGGRAKRASAKRTRLDALHAVCVINGSLLLIAENGVCLLDLRELLLGGLRARGQNEEVFFLLSVELHARTTKS
jgi:hypothetical protein